MITQNELRTWMAAGTMLFRKYQPLLGDDLPDYVILSERNIRERLVQQIQRVGARESAAELQQQFTPGAECGGHGYGPERGGVQAGMDAIRSIC